jgi:hypothetical protein
MKNVANLIEEKVETEVNQHPEIIIFNVLKRFEEEEKRIKIIHGFDLRRIIKENLSEGIVMRHHDGYYVGFSQKEKIRLPEKLQNLYNHFRNSPVSYCNCEYCKTTFKYIEAKKNLHRLKRRWEDGWDNAYENLKEKSEIEINMYRYNHRVAKEKMLRVALEGVNEPRILKEFKDLHFNYLNHHLHFKDASGSL